MRVAHCGCDTGMPQQHLNGIHWCASHGKVRCKGMPKEPVARKAALTFIRALASCHHWKREGQTSLASVVASANPVRLARDLLAKARATIQQRKQKKLEKILAVVAAKAKSRTTKWKNFCMSRMRRRRGIFLHWKSKEGSSRLAKQEKPSRTRAFEFECREPSSRLRACNRAGHQNCEACAPIG